MLTVAPSRFDDDDDDDDEALGDRSSMVHANRTNKENVAPSGEGPQCGCLCPSGGLAWPATLASDTAHRNGFSPPELGKQCRAKRRKPALQELCSLPVNL